MRDTLDFLLTTAPHANRVEQRAGQPSGDEQEREAREWRDACTQYFQQFSKRPLPAGVEPPEYPLEHYISKQLHYAPGTPGGS